MFSQLGSVEITCDAPPYEIVRACKKIKFHNPLDVRWVRSFHRVDSHPPKWTALCLRWWRNLLGLRKPLDRTCSCGEQIPEMRWYRFTYPSEQERDYALGQCRRCHTIYWDEV